MLSIGITIGYTQVQHIVLSIPARSLAAGIATALRFGAIAGISPAARAARLAPPMPSDTPKPAGPTPAGGRPDEVLSDPSVA